MCTGEFRNDEKHGQGQYTFKSGAIQKGQFTHDAYIPNSSSNSSNNNNNNSNNSSQGMKMALRLPEDDSNEVSASAEPATVIRYTIGTR